MTALVGLDVGTSSTKAIAVAPDGAVIGRAGGEYAVSTPAPGHAEQDPELWWRAAQAALGELDAGDVAGIGLSGQMHGLVLLDERLRPLRPAILWNDQRTAAECEEIERAVGLERLIELTGNRALTGFTAPKLLWVRRHEPDVYARIAHVLLPKDYVRLRLTGELATDVSDASGTLLFDVGARDWSEQVLELLGLPGEWLPPALEAAAVSGSTAAGVPVAAGGGDQAAGAVGVGVVRPGSVSVALGTSGVVFGVLPELAVDARGMAHTFCHAVPGTWHAMGVMLSAAGALEWLQRSVVPRTPIEALLDAAAGWEPGCEGLQFAPYLAGERTPHADPDARAAFATTPARSHGPCWRASRTDFATRSSCCAGSAFGRRRVGSAVAGAAATCGGASSPRCSTCRSRSRRPTTLRRSARRSWAASRPARFPTSSPRSRRASR
jgi:xylulokinase